MPLSARVPDLAALEMLLAVARTGSLNAAARQVGVTQQAVSARIKSAEAQAGVALVARTPRGSTLTPEGVVVAEWAARLLAVAGELDAGLAAFRRDHRTRLRVSASLTIAEQLLPGWLVSLQAAARQRGEPPAEVVLTAANSETVAQQVRDGAADLGFVEGPASPQGLRSRVIGHDELLVVVRPDHPWADRRQPLSPAELAATRLVSREEGSGTRDVLAAALTAALHRRTRGEACLPRCRQSRWPCPPPRQSGRQCWRVPGPQCSANWPSPRTSRRTGWPGSRSPASTCAARCARSGPAGSSRPRGAARDLLAHVTRQH